MILNTSELNIPGLPDGMTIDKDGYLWSAIFEGSRVIQFDPNEKNKVIREISLPAKRVGDYYIKLLGMIN